MITIPSDFLYKEINEKAIVGLCKLKNEKLPIRIFYYRGKFVGSSMTYGESILRSKYDKMISLKIFISEDAIEEIERYRIFNAVTIRRD